MNNTNISKSEYKEKFPKEIRIEALKQALDTRKFEIELYWKRSTYFWTFIAIAFGAYIALKTSNSLIENKGYMLIIISLLGYIFSLNWAFAQSGSKFWQENWEKHIGLLEDEIIGPLFKTILKEKNSTFWVEKISVSKINQITSTVINLLWVAIITYESWCISITALFVIALVIPCIFFVIYKFGKSTNQNGYFVD